MATPVPKPRSRKSVPRSYSKATAPLKEAVYTAEMKVTVRLTTRDTSAKGVDEILNQLVPRGESVVRTADGIDLVIVRH